MTPPVKGTYGIFFSTKNIIVTAAIVAIINGGKLIEDRNKHDLMSQLKVESFILDVADGVDQDQLTRLMACELPGVTLSRVDHQTLQVDVCHSASMNDVFARVDTS